MKGTQRLTAWAVLAVMTGTALLAPVAPAAADSKKTQQEATAASLAEAALLYNYGRKQNTTNGALALAGAAGTAYLWNQYANERRREERSQNARLSYYRRRAAYYHHLAANERRTALYHRTRR